MPHQSPSTFPIPFQQIFAAFCVLIADSWFFLFFFVANSKLAQLLITNETTKTENPNRIQREFDSNVAIRTFEFSSASKSPAPKTNLFKPLFSASLRLCVRLLSFAFADLLMAELLRRYVQTESKGNFCLMMLYNHKTKFRTQAIRPNSQTFSNLWSLLFSKTMKAFVGANRWLRPKIAEILKCFSLIHFCVKPFAFGFSLGASGLWP
jgi:hypothetical protein